MGRSRLEFAIQRLKAQRSCLNRAVALINGIAGPVLELGLGNGRSYDHLRELLAEEGKNREIFVFERHVAPHPDCVPKTDRLLLGDFKETLPQAQTRLGATAAFAHADFGSGNAEATEATARRLAAMLPPLLGPGAVVASDQDIPFIDIPSLPLPEDIEPGTYFLWRNSSEHH